jgi:hypothetical protein
MIDVAINRGAEAIKELGKADQKKHPNIKADAGSLAKYIQSFVDLGKAAKKGAKDAIKDYGNLRDNKIDYAKFKSQATINLKTPYGGIHVWTAKIVEMYKKLKTADKDDFVRLFTGKMVTAVYNAAENYEKSYASFLSDLNKL